jgi:hypothetical protein
VNADISPRLTRAILDVWGQIAPDVTWGPMNEPSNESAIETVIDADRLFNQDATAHDEWIKLVERISYSKALAALAARPTLQLI